MKKIVYSLTYNKTIKLHLQVIVERISDRVSVVAENLIWSFVHAGLNLFSPSDIFDSLQFANWMKNTKVGVAKTNKYLSVLNRKTIPNIS